MKIKHLSEKNSILNSFLAEIRTVGVQNDSMRFRRNIERIGEIMAYEISKTLNYKPVEITTPLGTKKTKKIANNIVLCSILRAGLALHQGFMNYFDTAENGFVSAYRHHYNNDDNFSILVEYSAFPPIQNKTLLLVDPMLATGQSIVAVLKKIIKEQQPKEIHIATVIAAPEGVAFLQEHLPSNVTLWIASLDEKLNHKNYIIPGLGDAGDLAYGKKQ